MNHYAAAALLTFITSAILTTFVFFKDRRKLVNKVFIQLSLVLTIYGLAFFNTCTSLQETKCLFWGKVTMFTAIWFAVTYLHLSLVTLKEKISRRLLISVYSIAVIYAIVDFPTKLLLRDPRPAHGIPLMNQAGLLYIPAVILFLGIVSFTVYRIARGMKISSPIKRNQLKYFIMAPIIAVIGGSSNFVVAYDITFYPINPFVGYLAPLFNVIIFYAIIQHKLLEISFVIRKVIANLWMLIIVSSSIICINSLPISINNKMPIYIIMMYLFAILYQKIMPKTESIINHILYKDKYQYQDNLETFIDNMPFIPGEKDLFRNTIKTTSETLGARNVAILTFDNVSDDYRLRDQLGLEDREGFSIPSDNGIVNWLKKNREVFVKEEMEKVLGHSEIASIEEVLSELGASVCVPVMLRETLMGIITLGEKASGDMYSHIDTRILHRLGNQLALALDYKRMEVELRKEHELAEITRNRLDAITTMSYGLADRINNYLQSITTFLGEFSEKLKQIEDKLPETTRESLKTLHSTSSGGLDKMIKLSREITRLCKPQGLTLQLYEPMVIMDIVNEVIEDLKPATENKEIKIDKRIEGTPPGTCFDREAIKKVLWHLIQNSTHAIPEGREGLIQVRITGPIKREEREFLRITVEDNGIGIPRENIEGIFNPFFTTKGTSGGLGLGLTICQFIINQHEGIIEVTHSMLDKGTTIQVDLPVRTEPPKPVMDYKDILGMFPARRKL